MPPKGRTSFKGPGQWRSQAEAARPDNIFAQLASTATRLAGKDETEAGQHVHEAEAALKDGRFEEAVAAMRAAARSCSPGARPYAEGLRAIAGQLEEQAAPPAPVPGAKDDDQGLDALS